MPSGSLAGAQGNLQPESKRDEGGIIEDEGDKNKGGGNKAKLDRRT